MAGLPFSCPPQICQEPIYAPTHTPILNAPPILAPIVQPSLASNAATDVISTFIPQLLATIQDMKKIMVHMQVNQGERIGQNNNRNTAVLSLSRNQQKPDKGNPTKHNQIFL